VVAANMQARSVCLAVIRVRNVNTPACHSLDVLDLMALSKQLLFITQLFFCAFFFITSVSWQLLKIFLVFLATF
jgi:hypothetical protein